MSLADMLPDELFEAYKKGSREEKRELIKNLCSDPQIRAHVYEIFLTPADLEISKRIIFTELI